MRGRGHLVGVAALLVLSACDTASLVTENSDPSPFEAAVRSGDSQQVRDLLERGADPDETREGVSVLTRAIWADRPKMVRLLVQNGATIHGTEEDGPGWQEVALNRDRQRQIEMAGLLLDLGYSPCGSIFNGERPSDELRDAGVQRDHPDLVARLRRAEAGCDE